VNKNAVAAILEEMGSLLELQGANPFKARAFYAAARTIEGLTRDLQAVVESGEIADQKGIGKSIAAIVTELVTTGKSREHAELRAAVPGTLLEMLKIQGMGPKKAKILYEKLRIKSVDELEKAARAGRLATLEGFGQKTQENILRGIESYRTSSGRSLYPAAAEAGEAVLASLRALKEVQRSELAGSLRRKKEVIGDVDIVLSARDTHRARIMEAFVTHPRVERVVARGETKSSVMLAGGIACDLRIVTDEEYPFALHYFTGSKEHNVAMRSRALRFGWSLNEYGFSKAAGGEKRGKARRIVRCASEADIYAALELAFIPPELRENSGELEAAGEDALPELVQEKDIRGTFHCHTDYSDGVNTLEEMVEAAQALGWRYLGIGDHSKGAAYAGGLSAERVREQCKHIDRLNASLKNFTVFKGTECDILPSGELDWPDRVLASFDYVVISVHSSFKMSEADMTRRIIRALKNRYVTMLGHPTGRLLLSREAYPVDMVKVIDAAADYGKMIEINAHPLRLDLDWRLVRYAREKKVLVPINPDAHTTDGLADVRYGVGIAQKGWLRKGDVPNTRSAAEVTELFASIRS